MKHDVAETLGYLLAAIIISFLISFLFCFIVQWAWNATMPHIFHLPEITLYQAFALSVLQSIFVFRPKVNKNETK